MIRYFECLFAFVSLLFLLRTPKNFVELGAKILTFHFGILAYVLLTGYGFLIFSSLLCKSSLFNGSYQYLYPVILFFVILTMTAIPSMSACHCINWKFASAFSPYWKQILILIFWIISIVAQKQMIKVEAQTLVP